MNVAGGNCLIFTIGLAPVKPHHNSPASSNPNPNPDGHDLKDRLDSTKHQRRIAVSICG